VILLKRN